MKALEHEDGGRLEVFKFDLQDRVRVPVAGIVGSVDIIAHDGVGRTYRIVHWRDAEKKLAWAYEREMERVDE